MFISFLQYCLPISPTPGSIKSVATAESSPTFPVLALPCSQPTFSLISISFDATVVSPSQPLLNHTILKNYPHSHHESKPSQSTTLHPFNQSTINSLHCSAHTKLYIQAFNTSPLHPDTPHAPLM